MQLITSSNSDRNLAAGATVLTATPDVSNPRVCYALIQLGDGAKNLSGSGGEFQVNVTIGGNAWLGGGQSYMIGTSARASLQTAPFCVPAGAAVTIAVTSPSVGDTDVDCTAYLMAEESLTMAVTATASAAASATATATINATASAAASAVLAAGDVDGYSVEQTLKLLLAVLTGKMTGATIGNSTVVIRAADDSKTRITATTDSFGNRTALTLDAAG